MEKKIKLNEEKKNKGNNNKKIKKNEMIHDKYQGQPIDLSPHPHHNQKQIYSRNHCIHSYVFSG